MVTGSQPFGAGGSNATDGGWLQAAMPMVQSCPPLLSTVAPERNRTRAAAAPAGMALVYAQKPPVAPDIACSPEVAQLSNEIWRRTGLAAARERPALL